MTLQCFAKTRFLALVSAAIALAGGLAPNAQAASVGPGGYTNSFSALPDLADWSTLGPPGAKTSWGVVADVDAGVQALNASDVNLQLNTDAANPPLGNANGVWSSTGLYVQTRPTGVAGTVLMCSLVNNLSGNAASVTILYDFNRVTNGTPCGVSCEEIDGLRAYYSLSGAAGSWVNIPPLSGAAPGRLSVTMSVNWPAGSTLYLLWADDKAVASSPDPAMQIDNFSATATLAPPVPVSIATGPQSQTVVESTPVSFSVVANGNPPPTFQWYKDTSSINNATNTSYTIDSTPFSYNGSHFYCIAANTVSSQHYFATSSVATLTVTADTNPPVANYHPSPGSTLIGLSFINVTFSKAVAGVDASDLLIDNVPASSFVTNNVNDYTFYFSQPPTGTVTVAWSPTHGITDTSPSMNPFGGGSYTYTLDTNLSSVKRVIISEFMADNGSGIKDEDGSRQDWIELLNIGLLQASLEGWYLTDDATNLTKWQFPVGLAALQPNNYLLVWASAKDRTNPIAPLHTNFNLGKSAEGYVALVAPSGTNVISYFTNYPVQFTDISYGRDFGDPNLVGYFTNATPRAQNSAVGSGLVPEPICPYDSGVYTNASLTLTITLSNAPVGSQIYYTLDKTNNGVNIPGTNSVLYTGPITFSTNLMIKIRAFPPNGSTLWPSEVVGKNFIFLDNTDDSFNSNLPFVIISTQGKGIPADVPSGTPRVEGTLAIFDTVHGRASIRQAPDFIGSAGFEIFGQTSAGFPKKPIRIEIHDPVGNDLKIPFLGLPSDSDWRLRNPYDDKTYLNDFMGYELFEQMGHYSCRRRLIECFIDTGGGRLNYTADYYGIMTLFETIKVNKDRVDVPSLTPSDTALPTVSGGYIFKKDKDSAGDLNFSTLGGNGFPAEGLKIHEPKPNDLRPVPLTSITSYPGATLTSAGSNQMAYLRNFLIQMETALYSPNYTNLANIGTTNHYSWYMDVDRFVDFALLVEYTKQIDGIRLSDYFTKDRGATNAQGQFIEGKVGPGPCWDWNLSFGNANYLRGGTTDTWYFAEQDQGITANEDIWLRRLMNGAVSMSAGNALTPGGGDPEFNQKFADRWSVLRKTILNGTNTLARIDELATYLSEAATRDAWGPSGKYRGSLVGILQWPNPNGAPDVNQRDVDYVNPQHYYGPIETVEPATASSSIIGQMKKWVLGRYLWIDAQFTQVPTISATDGMVTNGYLVQITPPAGATLYYTLDGSDPRAPGGGVAAGATAVAGQATLSINSNVRIVARAKTPTNLFYNTWSGPSAVSLYTAVPPLRITEIMYHPFPPPPSSPFDTEDFEYIEVKNIGGTPLNLNRFSLSGGVTFQFSNTVLAAGQRGVVVANIGAFQSRYGTNNPSILILGAYSGHLNNSGDHLTLSDPTQAPILDFDYSDGWYPTTDGLGFSLVAVNENAATSAWDTAANWRASSEIPPSFGSPGQDDGPVPSRPPILINEALTHSDTNLTPGIMDSIELYNPTASAVDISGWFLTDAFFTPQKFRIPAGTMIPANGYVVFTENDFNNPLNPNALLPFGLNAGGDQIYLFSGNGTALTGYEHGFDFGAAPNAATFGRYVISTGKEHFVLQTTSTLGSANAGPLVGPVVISAINYHPLDIDTNGVSFNNFADEYIMLKNITGSPVTLYDAAHPTNTWHIRNAVSFNFPQGTSLPTNGSLVVVNFDPAADATATAAWKSRNSIPGGTPLYGPWDGDLGNNSQSIELNRPDTPTTNDVPRILVEKVSYDDKAPWPVAADGYGLVLQRVVLSSYGNDPTNWLAVVPSLYAPGGGAPHFTNAPVDP